MHRKHTVEMRDMERWVVGGEGGEGGREKGREERERGEGKVVNITKERYQQMTQRLACTT